MSDSFDIKPPYQVVLKPGLYQSQNTKGGLNLNKWILKFLKRIGFAVTTDCCVYFPTFPVLGTHFESTDNVPNGGFFFDDDNTTLRYKDFDGVLQEVLLD